MRDPVPPPPPDAADITDLFRSGSGDGGLTASLSRWAADARIDEAAQERIRERWLRQQSAEEATMTGVLASLAERSRPVVVRTSAARHHRGLLTAVASDFCALRTAQGTDVLVAFDGVVSVHTTPGDDRAVGDRTLTIDVLLHEALSELSLDRPRVLVLARGENQGLAGELLSVGRDVLTLRLDGEPRSLAYVPLGSVVEVASV